MWAGIVDPGERQHGRREVEKADEIIPDRPRRRPAAERRGIRTISGTRSPESYSDRFARGTPSPWSLQ